MPRIVITGTSSDVAVDHQPMIQQALDAVEAGGGEVYIPDGVHYLGPQTPGEHDPGEHSMKIGDNVHLNLGRATLIRRFLGNNQVDATIRNKDFANGNNNIRVSGGTLTTSDDEELTGKHLGFVKAQNLRVDGVRFERIYGAWNTMFRDCEGVVVSDLIIGAGDSLFEDGLHFVGGARIAVANCVIWCGDDAIALSTTDLVPSTKDLTDVVIVNCFLSSAKANAIRIYVAGAEHEFAVRRVRISNIVAKTGDDDVENEAGGINFTDVEGLGRISEIEVDGFLLDALKSNNQPITLSNVAHVRLSRVVVRDPNARVWINGSDDVELRDCIVASPRAAAQQCVLVAEDANCTNVRIVGGHYRHATHHVITLGTPNGSVTGFEVSGAFLEGKTGEGGSLYGLSVANAFEGIVYGNKMTGPYWGIVESGDSNENLYIANRLNDNPDGGLQLSGAASEGIRNVVDAAKRTDDSGGFRQTIDGWQLPDVVGTTTGFEMTRVGGRFRAARPGSVTGVVMGTAHARAGGSVTATVFKTTGVAGGSSPLFNTGLSATVNTGSDHRDAATQPMNMNTNSIFDAGDELFIMLSSSGWSPDTTAYAALEIEN